MTSKAITVKALSKGGACGKCIKLDLTNNTDTEFAIAIDPGLIFTPSDDKYQHLVLMGQETIALAPHATSTIDLQTFCGKSYAWGPKPNLGYSYWRQGDSNMVKMLRYANENNISKDLVQRAVWTFTNAHCLNSVYDYRFPQASEAFVAYIAKLKKCSLPDFFMEYGINNISGQPIMTHDARIYVTLHWGHEGYRNMYLDIYKANGDHYKRINADRYIDKNGNTVQVEFDPIRDPKGAYNIVLHDDSRKIWDQKQVIVGVDPCNVPR
jgi:hypothetical protein